MLRLYNSFTKRVEALLPQVRLEKQVSGSTLEPFKWYLCGPTVYDDAHLGHGRTFVIMDWVKRYLIQVYPNLRILQAMSITDVDDKIISRAKALNKSPRELSKYYADRFFRDMDVLSVALPDHRSQVTDNIGESIIPYIQTLLDKGFAYISRDEQGVYFDTEAYEKKYGVTYGVCFRHFETSMVSENDLFEKKNAKDFALWKFRSNTESPEYAWKTDFGSDLLGRPGWHIECSAMANRVFGSKLDFHSGGMDLKFPHHENELAQCHAHQYDSSTMNKIDSWCPFWFHVAPLVLASTGDKMSKSLGNMITLNQFFEKHHPNVFRIMCLESHYSKPMEYSKDRLLKAITINGHIETCVFKLKMGLSYYHENLNNSALPMDEYHKKAHSYRLGWSKNEEELVNRVTACYADVLAALENDLQTKVCLDLILGSLHMVDEYLSRSKPEEYNPTILDSIKNLFFDRILGKLMGFSFGKRSCDFADSPRSSNSDIITRELFLFRDNIRSLSLDKSFDSLHAAELRSRMLGLCDHLRATFSKHNIRINDQKVR
jgi:cysteinyl-tRNA synthetase